MKRKENESIWNTFRVAQRAMEPSTLRITLKDISKLELGVTHCKVGTKTSWTGNHLSQDLEADHQTVVERNNMSIRQIKSNLLLGKLTFLLSSWPVALKPL